MIHFFQVLIRNLFDEIRSIFLKKIAVGTKEWVFTKIVAQNIAC